MRNLPFLMKQTDKGSKASIKFHDEASAFQIWLIKRTDSDGSFSFPSPSSPALLFVWAARQAQDIWTKSIFQDNKIGRNVIKYYLEKVVHYAWLK